MNLDEFISEIQQCEKDPIDKLVIKALLNMEAKAQKWSYIVKLLLNSKKPLYKHFLLTKLGKLRDLMKFGLGFEILDIEKKIVYFQKYPKDKITYMEGY